MFSEDHGVIHQGVVAQSCVVDNEGSNIFFVEGEARNIQVVSTDPVSPKSTLFYESFTGEMNHFEV